MRSPLNAFGRVYDAARVWLFPGNDSKVGYIRRIAVLIVLFVITLAPAILSGSPSSPAQPVSAAAPQMHAQPAPVVPPAPQPVETAPTSAPTPPVVGPVSLGDIQQITACALNACATFPSAGGPEAVTRTGGDQSDLPPQLNSDMVIDTKLSQACAAIYPEGTPCPEADAHESYMVGVDTHTFTTAKEALAYERAKLTPDVFTDVTEGTFAGQPALVSTFHARFPDKAGKMTLHGGGPYIDVFYKGNLYHVWATSMTSLKPRYATEFRSSFKFTS